MKKYIYTVLLIQCSFWGYSQTLCDTNKIWSIVECGMGNYCFTKFLKFDGDTVLGLKNYKKLNITLDSMQHWSYFDSMREDSSKKVFINDGMQEYLLYDFNLNVGDTTTTYTCSNTWMVDSINMLTLLNGEQRRRLFLHPTNSGWGVIEWIEGIGSNSGILHEQMNLCWFDISAELNCFTENDTLKYSNPYYTSCFYNTTSISENVSKVFWKISPNPFSKISTLIIEDNIFDATLSIYDVKGEVVRRQLHLNSNEITIDKDNLYNGIYFFQLMPGNGKPIRGKFIVQ